MLFKNLQVPSGRVDVVLDTDAYNEIDDQFAISYMLRSKEKLNVKAIYAAPFLNQHSESPKDGKKAIRRYSRSWSLQKRTLWFSKALKAISPMKQLL